MVVVSETGVPSLNVRNTLILEAYCRAAPHHMHSLTQLHEALKTLRGEASRDWPLGNGDVGLAAGEW